MVRPHYVAKRVGDEYVLVRVDSFGHLGRVVSGGIGLALMSRAISRGGLVSMLCCAAGAGFLYHAATGRDPINLIGNKDNAPHGDDRDSPSFPGEAVSRQLPTDALEEASMESFPASDPPASMHSTGQKVGAH